MSLKLTRFNVAWLDLKTSSPLLRELLFFDFNEAGIWASKGGTMNLSLPFLDHPEDADRIVQTFDQWLVKRKDIWMQVAKEMAGKGRL